MHSPICFPEGTRMLVSVRFMDVDSATSRDARSGLVAKAIEAGKRWFTAHAEHYAGCKLALVQSHGLPGNRFEVLFQIEQRSSVDETLKAAA